MAPAPLIKPTIVIVHGSFHRPEHFKYLTKQLEQAGYNVFAVKLPSVGVRSTPLENAVEADAITTRDTLQPILNHGTDVVLVMHSYGGIPGSQAVCMLKKASTGKILHLVYIAALIVEIGSSHAMCDSGVNKSGTKVIDNHLVYRHNPIPPLYQDVSKERADEAVALLEPTQLSTFTSLVTHAAWKEEEIPVTYVACKQDCTVSPPYQERVIKMIKASNSEVEIVTMDCGHCPFLTDEGRVADIIRKAAGEKLGGNL